MNEQLQLVQEQIRAERAKGDEKNPVVLAQLEREEADILAQIAQEKADAIEEKVQGEDIPLAVTGINFTGVPGEVIALIDAVVKADRRRLLNEHAIELEQAEQAHADELQVIRQQNTEFLQKIETIQGDIDSSTADNAQLARENADLRAQVHDQDVDIDDLSDKLANAAAQIVEKDAEIDRLKSELDDYQKAKAFGEREAQKMIDVTPDESSNINAAVEAVRKWAIGSAEEKAAKAVDAWSKRNPEWTVPELQMRTSGGSESADSFRDEAQPTSDQLRDGNTETTSAVPDAPVGSQFPETETESVLGAQSSAVGQVAESDDRPVTRSEFEALKRRMEVIEDRLQPTVGAA